MLLQNVHDAEITAAKNAVNALLQKSTLPNACTTELRKLNGETLSKLHDQMKNNNNAEYKISAIAKALFTQEGVYEPLTIKEAHFKHVKEVKKGAMDLAVKLLVMGEYTNDDNITSWSTLETWMINESKTKAFTAGNQQGFQAGTQQGFQAGFQQGQASAVPPAPDLSLIHI